MIPGISGLNVKVLSKEGLPLMLVWYRSKCADLPLVDLAYIDALSKDGMKPGGTGWFAD